MLTRVEAIKLLESLGSTADEVAQSLRDKGIKGPRCYMGYCPLAKLIGGQVCIQGAYIPCNNEEGFELPQACKDFIRKFDCGEYLDLHEERPRPSYFTCS
jgi:hypothetical protein